MKKLLTALLITVLMFTVCACESGSNSTLSSETASLSESSNKDSVASNSSSSNDAEETKIKVPNVFGMTLSDATKALEEAGFVVQSHELISRDQHDIVINQSLSSDTLHKEGTTIEIIYCSYPYKLNDDGTVTLTFYSAAQVQGGVYTIPDEFCGKKVSSVDGSLCQKLMWDMVGGEFTKIYYPKGVVEKFSGLELDEYLGGIPY